MSDKTENKPAVEEEDETAAMLAQAGQLLAQAASNKKRRSALLKDAEAALSKISLADAEELSESPVIQAFLKLMGVGDLKPGEVRNRGTLAERMREYTPEDFAQLPQITFIPAISDDFTINGVGPYRLVAGAEVTVPEPVYDRYRQVLKIKARTEQHLQWLMGKTDAAPHPDLQTVEGAKVRAYSIGGRQFGVLGGTLTTGMIHTESEEE